mgnify:CR=1 FL=1
MKYGGWFTIYDAGTYGATSGAGVFCGADLAKIHVGAIVNKGNIGIQVNWILQQLKFYDNRHEILLILDFMPI